MYYVKIDQDGLDYLLEIIEKLGYFLLSTTVALKVYYRKQKHGIDPRNVASTLMLFGVTVENHKGAPCVVLTEEQFNKLQIPEDRPGLVSKCKSIW